MTLHTVRIHLDEQTSVLKAEKGVNILKFLHDNSFDVPSPCGGRGKCGKCRIKIRGLDSGISENEKKLLGSYAIEQGYRLACFNTIESDLDIYLDEESKRAAILETGKTRSVRIDPAIIKKSLKLFPPSLDDQTPDFERLSAQLDTVYCPVEVLRSIPAVLRDNDFNVTAVISDNFLIAIEPGDTTTRLFGLAVDIGSTTLAAYLYDMNSGKRLNITSSLNPQKVYGADVLSRIGYAMTSRDKEKEMHECLVNGINGLIGMLCKESGIRSDEIYQATFVGNTTMMHFLMRLPAGNIAVSPFIPVTTGLQNLTAQELGIDINRYGRVVIYPCVSGYIGADTVAAVLSSGMYESEDDSLLIDIGTNGEIVFGNKERLYACSTAAGPAFEGANISHGIGGVVGAIDKVFFDGKLKYTTIGNERAVGICGSGVVDAIAVLLEKGIIDETGRILDEDECSDLPQDLVERIIEIEGMKAIRLTGVDENETIIITQKDIRELQNAKAAIAAGITTLIRKAEIPIDRIASVYLAGGFGNYINVESAVKIGLIPAELKSKVEPIGNAAGEGASEGLISKDLLRQTVEISRKIKYIELSASAEFVNDYVNNMMFGDL